MKNGTNKSVHQGREGGFAIVLTLLVLTMMTVLVIGFNAATRTEQMAARNFSYQEQANQMAMLGVNRAVALLNSNVGTTGLVATQPGRLFSPAGGVVALSSASVPGTQAGAANINASQATNFFISPNTNASAFTVPLIEVRSGTNPIGRYGFWVDDDGSRLNLNAASLTARANFLPTNARPLLLGREMFPAITANHWGGMSNHLRVLLDPTSTATANIGWGYFLTPRQISGLTNIGSANYNTMMFQIGAGPPNVRPANSYALGNNGVASALDTTNSFLTAYGGAATTLPALNTALNSVADRFFRGTAYQTYFGQAGGFATKYGNVGMRQVIANINDAVLSGAGGGFTGATSLDMLMAPDTTGTNPPAPSTVLGLRPAPFLNEVAVGVALSTNAPATVAEIQVWMQSELVDPYFTGQGGAYEIRYKIGSLQFSGTYMVGGNTLSFSNTPFSANWNFDGGIGVTGIGNVANREFKVPPNAFVFEWQLGGATGTQPPLPNNASNITLTRVTVRPLFVVLRAQQNRPLTVRDWAIAGDFPANGFVFTNVQVNAAAYGYNGSGARPAPNSRFTQSVEKNDPRVRRYGVNAMPGSPAWYPVSTPTLGANNNSVNFAGGTGVSGVGNDRLGGVTATTIFDHPSFGTNSTNFILARSNWVSVFDLSKIHTGLQWRTLQFRAQDSSESGQGHVPDWALLEALTVSNAAAPSSFRLNINSIAYPAAGSMSAAAVMAGGLSRPAAAGALLAGMTASNAPSAAIGGVNLRFPASAGFANAAAAMPVASNVASLAFTTSWASRRAANTNYATNLYRLSAEILEVAGVSNFSTDEAANEARAEGAFGGVAVASQTFTVYSAGFATDRQGNVVAESRVRAQIVRRTNSTRFGVTFLEPLIWP